MKHNFTAQMTRLAIEDAATQQELRDNALMTLADPNADEWETELAYSIIAAALKRLEELEQKVTP